MTEPSTASIGIRPRPTVANEDSFRERLYWAESDGDSGGATVARRTSLGSPTQFEQPAPGPPGSPEPADRQSLCVPPEVESGGEAPARAFDDSRDERVRTSTKPPSGARYDILYTSAEAKNVAVHLELDLHPDIDDEVEEFCRLTRLGDFRNAKCFFDEHLRAFARSPAVFVLYAEMLFEMGDYKSVMLLDPDSVFSSLDYGEKSAAAGDLESLYLNWTLIKVISLSHTQHELQAIASEFETMTSPSPAPWDRSSTVIRICSLLMRLSLDLGVPSKLAPLFDVVNWEKQYQQLLAEGQIWDFKEIITSSIDFYGFNKAVRVFFGPRDAIETILNDWKTTETDDSTQLALLGILSSMALSCLAYPETRRSAEHCLAAADALGESVLQNLPQHVKTRPFLQWVMAKSALSTKKHDGASPAFGYLDYYPGEAMLPRGIGLPYYIPVGQENPGWMPPDLDAQSSEPLETAMNAAAELEDHETRAACLAQLISKSRDPRVLFQKLAHLQKVVQGDMSSYLTTCLSRYLLTEDQSSRRELRADLAEFDWDDDPENLASPIGAASRDILLRALSDRTGQHPPNSAKAGLKYYESLPKFFQQFIDRNMPDHSKPNRALRPSRDRSLSGDRGLSRDLDRERAWIHPSESPPPALENGPPGFETDRRRRDREHGSDTGNAALVGMRGVRPELRRRISEVEKGVGGRAYPQSVKMPDEPLIERVELPSQRKGILVKSAPVFKSKQSEAPKSLLTGHPDTPSSQVFETTPVVPGPSGGVHNPEDYAGFPPPPPGPPPGYTSINPGKADKAASKGELQEETPTMSVLPDDGFLV